MLKLELREAARVILPPAESAKHQRTTEIEEAVSLMRRWRHYAE